MLQHLKIHIIPFRTVLCIEIGIPVFRSVDQCICLSKTKVVVYNRMPCSERKRKGKREVSREHTSVDQCEPKHILIVIIEPSNSQSISYLNCRG